LSPLEPCFVWGGDPSYASLLDRSVERTHRFPVAVDLAQEAWGGQGFLHGHAQRALRVKTQVLERTRDGIETKDDERRVVQNRAELLLELTNAVEMQHSVALGGDKVRLVAKERVHRHERIILDRAHRDRHGDGPWRRAIGCTDARERGTQCRGG